VGGMILVLAEVSEDNHITQHSLELMNVGKKLAAPLDGGLCACLIGSGIAEAGEELANHGAEKAYLADEPWLLDYNPDFYLPILKDLCAQESVQVLLAGHTSMAQDLMPRLAFDLGVGLVTDCAGVEVDSGSDNVILFEKPIYGGNAIASFATKTLPCMATIRARVGEVDQSPSAPGRIVPISSSPSVALRMKPVERVRERKQQELDKADVVVSGGRGMGGPEGFDQLSRVAEILGGAVGASRPPCDSGWIDSASQVGITGKVVAPDLYIAVAISGTSQHLSGMSEAKYIVAINKDPDAYIFKVANYGIVGDWRQVLPPFVDQLRHELEERR
jgi:electron transfer flavoprotein alpha subunit